MRAEQAHVEHVVRPLGDLFTLYSVRLALLSTIILTKEIDTSVILINC